jgi:hypothetical protein
MQVPTAVEPDALGTKMFARFYRLRTSATWKAAIVASFKEGGFYWELRDAIGARHSGSESFSARGDTWRLKGEGSPGVKLPRFGGRFAAYAATSDWCFLS